MSDLKKKREELQNQQKQAEMNFHQVTGALAVVEQMIEEEEQKPKEGRKSTEKVNAKS
tara:strand:+ start:408 stop:581 length:174 start_codon:yes stop_codon:yes gene_type:complete